MKNPAEPFYAVARQFISQRLLATPALAADSGSGGAATSDGSEEQRQRPLAARVLGGLQAKEQAWVRSQIEKWSKGGWVGW